MPKFAYTSLNLITADTAHHYNQHAAEIICITNNFNLISYYTCYTWSCIFFTCLYIYIYIYIYIYTGCPRGNVPDFGRVFPMLKYTYITQNTYVQSWTVKEILAREKCGLLTGPRTVPVSWQSYPCLPLSVVSYDSSSAHATLIPQCAVSFVTSPLGSHLSCVLLGTLRTTMTWVRVFL